MARIPLIGWRNQAGLTRDLGLLADVLGGAGHDVQVDGLTPLEATLARLLGTGESRLEELGRAAADWFEANDRSFRNRLRETVSRILSAPPAPASAR